MHQVAFGDSDPSKGTYMYVVYRERKTEKERVGEKWGRETSEGEGRPIYTILPTQMVKHNTGNY